MKPVNIGIDLGTTNSLVAKFENNTVRVFKNPVGQKETLASVVAFRKDRTLIGDKAREYLTKDAVNVFGGFKRKMGTDEKYYVVNIDENVTPVELSAYVLKELKSFLQSGEPLEACVITIPASFDSMQSSATRKAGLEAGFQQVFLLQEPIAASLAFFNSTAEAEAKQEGNWLVYDLGGGTFDVALVQSSQNELKVIDHEGNNFLGGMDFDFAIINHIIIPAIIKETKLQDFEEEFRVKYGKYEMLYYQVMYYAEEAKKELSNSPETVIEFSAVLNDQKYDFYIPVTKTAVDELFRPIIEETIKLLKKILDRNKLKVGTINQIILVGGSTFLPQVREQLITQTGLPINHSLDPTTAIAIGAAFYASNKYYEPVVAAGPATAGEALASGILATVDFDPVDMDIGLAYSRSTRDMEEVLLISATGEYDGRFYRITRTDGGFDTGFINLKPKKTEFLPLIPAMTNMFMLRVYDAQRNEMTTFQNEISIIQGVYNIDGQPLPQDISIEIDDLENKTTKLEVIFERNSLLPQKRTLYREISKTIRKGSNESIIINILEGERNSRPSSNLTIGCIEISGKDLKVDLVKGSDIEIQIEVSESRLLNTAVFLVMTQQEFRNVFSISEKQVNVPRLKEQFLQLEHELVETLKGFQYNEEDIWEITAANYLQELKAVGEMLARLKDNDKTDEKYIVAEKMTRISQEIDKLGGNERIATLIETYLDHKDRVLAAIQSADFEKDELLRRYKKLEQSEPSLMRSRNASVIGNKLQQLHELHWSALANTTSFLIGKFIEFKSYEAEDFKDHAAAVSLVKLADAALSQEKYPEFRRHVFTLSSMLKTTTSYHNKEFKGTGIG
ncbi:MAG: Hsp70 family protein [Ferruginibacter sp.]